MAQPSQLVTHASMTQVSCPLQDLSAAVATRNLQDSIGSAGSNQLFILRSADLVERRSICGNLVCEAGERPTTTNGANGGAQLPPLADPTACCCFMFSQHSLKPLYVLGSQ